MILDELYARLASMTSEMREAQRIYFRTRSATSLRDAKRLETQVDHLLVDIKNARRSNLTPPLFPDEAQPSSR